MHGSLARKLRALGFDTDYHRNGTDASLLAKSSREGRVILTSDRELAARATAKGISAVLLRSKSDGGRVAEVAAYFRESSKPLIRGPPLCSVCGGELLSVGKAEAKGDVPPAVVNRHRLFFRCVDCGHLYWRGSHWKKLRSLSLRLGQDPFASNDRRRKKGGAPREGDSGSPRKGDRGISR